VNVCIIVVIDIGLPLKKIMTWPLQFISDPLHKTQRLLLCYSIYAMRRYDMIITISAVAWRDL